MTSSAEQSPKSRAGGRERSGARSGLRRRGVPREAIRELKEAFRTVYFTKGNLRALAAQALASGQFPSAEARRFLEFMAGGSRGIARAARPERPSADDADHAA